MAPDGMKAIVKSFRPSKSSSGSAAIVRRYSDTTRHSRSARQLLAFASASRIFDSLTREGDASVSVVQPGEWNSYLRLIYKLLALLVLMCSWMNYSEVLHIFALCDERKGLQEESHA